MFVKIGTRSFSSVEIKFLEKINRIEIGSFIPRRPYLCSMYPPTPSFCNSGTENATIHDGFFVQWTKKFFKLLPCLYKTFWLFKRMPSHLILTLHCQGLKVGDKNNKINSKYLKNIHYTNKFTIFYSKYEIQLIF